MGEKRSGTRRGRWFRRGGLVLVAMPLVVFFGSNLLMRGAWFRGKLAGRLEMATRLSWTVETASWSPWGGVRLGGLTAVAFGTEADKIPPIFEIEEVRVQPYWKPLMAGRLQIRELQVTRPRGKVPVELLVQLMRSDGRVGVARLGGATGESAGTSGRQADVPESSGTEQPASDRDPAPDAAPDADARTAGERPDPREEPKPGPDGRIIMVDGDMEVYSMAAPERSLRVRGLGGVVPLGGVAADGWLEVAESTVGGEVWAGPLRVPLRWNNGVLEWPAGEFEWSGMTVQTAGSLRTRGRLAGAVELRAVAPRLSPRPIPGWDSAECATGPVEVRARLSGEILRPVTWHGNIVAGVGGVQFVHPGRGDSIVFDQARFVADLRGGVLQVVDGTLAGERLSFFGNGFMIMDGRVYGVARVVAAPDLAEGVTRVVNGTRLTADYVEAWLKPLVTPDRYYRDIHVQGSWQACELDLGPEESWVDGKQALRLFQMFVRREEAEEIMKNQNTEGGTGL